VIRRLFNTAHPQARAPRSPPTPPSAPADNSALKATSTPIVAISIRPRILGFRNSSLSFPLKLSQYPFSHDSRARCTTSSCPPGRPVPASIHLTTGVFTRLSKREDGELRTGKWIRRLSNLLRRSEEWIRNYAEDRTVSTASGCRRGKTILSGCSCIRCESLGTISRPG